MRIIELIQHNSRLDTAQVHILYTTQDQSWYYSQALQYNITTSIIWGYLGLDTTQCTNLIPHKSWIMNPDVVQSTHLNWTSFEGIKLLTGMGVLKTDRGKYVTDIIVCIDLSFTIGIGIGKVKFTMREASLNIPMLYLEEHFVHPHWSELSNGCGNLDQECKNLTSHL